MIYSYSVILIVLWKFTPRDFTCLSLVQRKLVFSASEPTRFHPKSLLLFLPPPPPFCSILQIARMSIFNTLRLFYFTHFTQEIICKYLASKSA